MGLRVYECWVEQNHTIQTDINIPQTHYYQTRYNTAAAADFRDGTENQSIKYVNKLTWMVLNYRRSEASECKQIRNELSTSLAAAHSPHAKPLASSIEWYENARSFLLAKNIFEDY